MDVGKVRRNLEAHGFQTSFFETKEEANAYLCRALAGHTVGIGGSMTVEAMGLYPRLQGQARVMWHWKAEDAEQTRLDCQGAEIYLCSANGVSESGEIVNIDGTGNRLAATMYSHQKVYIIIGINKIEPTLERAVWRARNIAAPLNAKRFGIRTPCAVSPEMHCYDCDHPQRLCKGLLVLWRKMNGVGECEVVIINEALGY